MFLPYYTVEHNLSWIYVSALAERALGQREEPALLVRRRLEQAGYDPADNLEAMGGEDLGFLLRFIFRNASLGGIDVSDIFVSQKPGY